MMSPVQKGLAAGIAATLAVSALDAANLYFGPWAAAFPRLLSFILQTDGNMIIGWGAHFAVGTLVLGPVFGLLCPRLPTDTPESKGIVFAVGAWFLMMLTVAPLGGVGFFAVAAGFPTLAWLLFTHVVYGIVLGAVYGWMVQRDRRAARAPTGAAHA